jgi:hypothetical protein
MELEHFMIKHGPSRYCPRRMEVELLSSTILPKELSWGLVLGLSDFEALPLHNMV